MTVSWLPASDDTTPVSSIKYQVHASTDASFTPNASTLKFEGTGVTSATITSGLVAGSNYTVRLLALDAGGASTASTPLTATISNVAASSVSGVKVQTLQVAQVTSVTSTSVVLQAGVTAPAVNTFISSADANGGQGYLRKVVGVSQAGGVTTLQTQVASINEVVSDIKVSSSFKMDTVPTEVANSALQAGLATVGMTKNDITQQTYSWPESGFRYQTTAVASTLSAAQPSLHQAGLNIFNASNSETAQGTWGKVFGNNRIEIAEGSTGINTLTVSITDFSTPWDSLTPVGVCKLTLGAITSKGESSKPSGINLSLGKFEKAQTVAASGLIKVANQTIDFSAATGTATDMPYKVTATAYLDDVGDGCAGDTATGFWRETINFELEIFVTTDKFPTKETASKTFDGTGDFKVKNEIVNTFAPKVVFDQTISGTKLTYARMGVQAVSRLDQVLTIDATAKGTMNKTLEIINPRKFFKVYMTPAGIPIVISGILRMDMRIQGDVSGALNVTEKLSIGYDDISYGFEYKNGSYVPYSEVLPVYTLKVGGKGEAEANLQISLLPSLEITAYEAITGKAVLEPYLTASAGVEGFVQLDAAVDFDTAQTNMAADADYRLTKTRLGAGLNAWLYADLSVWEKTLLVWPEKADKNTYTSYHKLELMPDSTIMDLPKLSAFLPTGVNTVHPQDACAFKVRAIANDTPNELYTKFPFMSDVYIQWKRWTAPRIIAPLGVPSDSYGFLPDPNGEKGVYWASFTKPGIYTVRVGGHSNWGTWARQYTEIKIDATDGLTSSAGLRPCAMGNLNATPTNPTVSQAISLWISDAYTTVKSVVWNFGVDIAEQTAVVVNGISTTVTQTFSTIGAKPITATLKDAANKTLGTLTTTINVSALPIPTAIITGATSDTTTQPGAIANNGTTDDTTPTLKGTLSAALTGTQHVNIYDNDTQFAAYATVSGTSWAFTPASPLAGGSHSFTADVGDALGNTGARSAAYVINILAPGITSATPAEAMRTVPTTFTVVGRDLPTSGITVTMPDDTDPRAKCNAPTSMTATGFTVVCTLYKFDEATDAQRKLVISAGAKQLGTHTVSIKSNITDVNWAAPSSGNVYGKGTVQFKEDITFKATGTNLLADTGMGFAVELCGVANKEVGTPTNTQRTFTCMFNNEAGAVAGQMPLVFKDKQGGGGLYRVNVPVEVTPVSPQPNPFTVDAVKEAGTSFTVPSGATSCLFTVSGSWNWDAYSPAVDASGNGPTYDAGGVWQQPSAPAFSLVAKRQSGLLQLIGLSNQMAVSSGERIVFLMNDVIGAYGDNRGGVSVSYSCNTSSITTSKLPDTGITAAQCYAAGSNALVSCTSPAAIALNPKQDGMVGRDVSSPSNTDGKLGFSYSTVGSYSKEECVKDNITGLTWEGKPTTGLRAAGNTYTNLGNNSANDASTYVAAVNAAKLCGYSDWRLPTVDELQGLVDYGVAYPGPTIDGIWFPNTQPGYYWTGTGYAGCSGNACVVSFVNGYVDGYNGGYVHVRLVR